MFGKMKELMEMKKQADRIKQDLDQVSAEVTDVAGIRIVINGAQDFRSIDIEERFLRPENKLLLEKDLRRAVNAAVKKSQMMAAEKMRAILPNIPGF